MKDLVIGSPYLIQFNLLTKCIFDCPYCYLKDIKNTKEIRLDFDDYKKFLGIFSKYYQDYGLTLQIDLTGGDLWFYPQIKELLEYTYKLPYVEGIGMMFNSLWFKDSKRILEKYKEKITLVQLNIDAVENRETDFEILRKLSIPAVVKVLISSDQEYFEKQIKALRKLRRKNKEILVSVDRLCPVSNDQLSKLADIDRVGKMLKLVIAESDGCFLSDDPMIQSLAGYKNQSWCEIKGCAIPSGGVTVFPNGDVKLCARIPGFMTGFSIKNFDLGDYIDKFKPMMDARLKKCGGCEFENICNGGCPATSFVKLGGKIGRDNNCVKEEKKMLSILHNHKNIRTIANSLVCCYLMAAGYFVDTLEVGSESEKELYKKMNKTKGGVKPSTVIRDAVRLGLRAEYVEERWSLKKWKKILLEGGLIIFRSANQEEGLWWLLSGLTGDGGMWITDPRIRNKQVIPETACKLLASVEGKVSYISVKRN